jgi:hypothetical protein
MNIVKCETFYAKVVVGLQSGYQEKFIPVELFKKTVFQIQKELNDIGITISVKLSPCEILFLGQDEASISLEFINYPKFPMAEKEWKSSIITFIETLMIELEQNRVVIVFHDETIMLEQSDNIDPKINI